MLRSIGKQSGESVETVLKKNKRLRGKDFHGKNGNRKNGQRGNSAAKIEMVGKKATQNYCLK